MIDLKGLAFICINLMMIRPIKMVFQPVFRTSVHLSNRQIASTQYDINTCGDVNTPSFRTKLYLDKKEISPWHDIPLKSGQYYNFITEIPKNSKAKMEVQTKENLNPIAQDIKKGILRDYHGPIFWNYGCLPQTWENPNIVHPSLKVRGDNDPLDVIEIGSKVFRTGEVVPVKLLGVLAMIDDGELDWKVISISATDSLADKLNDVNDVETHCPGVVSGIREWLRWYKSPDGKPLNRFGFEEKALNRAFAEEIVQETHHYWQELVDGKVSCKTEGGTLWIPSKSNSK